MNATHPYSKQKHRYDKKWKQDHPAAVQQSRDKYNRSLRGRYARLVIAARQRHLELKISYEEYETWVSRPCFYCGDELPPVGYGLDRIDSAHGYVADNVRPCCQQCNRAKTDLSEGEFYAWVRKLVAQRRF